MVGHQGGPAERAGPRGLGEPVDRLPVGRVDRHGGAPRSAAPATKSDTPAEQSTTRPGSRSGSSAKKPTYSANDREVTSTYGIGYSAR